LCWLCLAALLHALRAWVRALGAGRLNVLANVVRKPLRQIFSEFAGVGPEGEGQEYFGTGDVKYHLGTSYDRPTTSGKRVHLSLLANPSHLEARCPFLPLVLCACTVLAW
jgi:2-oxoglutarate dehydrogenase complex dehydrogenase (E1) component-like enzyme